MKLFQSLLQASMFAGLITQACAASWTFTDGTVSVQSKGSGGQKESLTPSKPVQKGLNLGPNDSLKIILTAQEGKSAKRPHQAYLQLKDATSNLDISYPLSVKENGKAKVDLTQKDLPTQFLRNQAKITASLVLASFGSSTGYNSPAFKLEVVTDTTGSSPTEKALRYGKLPEIHHIFRADQKMPNKLISVIFTFAAIAPLQILLATWIFLNGNVNHLSKAMSDAPIAHALFIASIIGLEFVLFMYYCSWNLFQTLPALAAIGTVTFLSGSRALTEVQDRRLAGLR